MSRLPSPMVPMPWPVTATVIHAELRTMQDILNRWSERFADAEYVQSVDELDDLARQQWFGQLVNELKVCASKSATLVEVLA